MKWLLLTFFINQTSFAESPIQTTLTVGDLVTTITVDKTTVSFQNSSEGIKSVKIPEVTFKSISKDIDDTLKIRSNFTPACIRNSLKVEKNKISKMFCVDESETAVQAVRIVNRLTHIVFPE